MTEVTEDEFNSKLSVAHPLLGRAADMLREDGLEVRVSSLAYRLRLLEAHGQAPSAEVDRAFIALSRLCRGDAND